MELPAQNLPSVNNIILPSTQFYQRAEHQGNPLISRIPSVLQEQKVKEIEGNVSKWRRGAKIQVTDMIYGNQPKQAWICSHFYSNLIMITMTCLFFLMLTMHHVHG